MILHIMSSHDHVISCHMSYHNIYVCVGVRVWVRTRPLGFVFFILFTKYTILQTGFKPKSQRDSRDILSSSSRRIGRRESVAFCPTNLPLNPH